MLKPRQPTQQAMRVAKAICRAHGIDPEARTLHEDKGWDSVGTPASAMPGAIEAPRRSHWYSIPNWSFRVEEAISHIAAFEQMMKER